MGLKAGLSKLFALLVNRQLNKLRQNAPALQQKTFLKIIEQAKNTAFGKEHHFDQIKNLRRF